MTKAATQTIKGKRGPASPRRGRPKGSKNRQRKWMTIAEMVKKHPERKVRTGLASNPAVQARRQAIVEDYLTTSMRARDVARKHGVSYGYVCYLVADYRRWVKRQKAGKV